MRIEKQFLAYGHDLDADINPIQAGLGFAIDRASDFIGKQALLSLRKKQQKSAILSFIFDDINAQPLGNEPVYSQGQIIGQTTSASFGYRVGKPVALGYIRVGETLEDSLPSTVEIDIAGERFQVKVLNCCAFDPGGKCMRP